MSTGQVPITKKVNNFVIDASAYASVQSQGPPAPSASVGKSSKQQAVCHSTKSSNHTSGPTHHKTHSSGAATTKHSALKNASHQGWKFVERRLSAKVLHDA